MHKKKKKFIQVAGNPLYAKPRSHNEEIINPLSGTTSFGQFPEITHKDVCFQAGVIYLRYGKHIGPNSGFGLAHIWAEHFKHTADVNDATTEIATFVATTLQNGSIYYELGNRNLVFKKNKGVVILEARLDGQGNQIYVVITAFAGGSSHGILIGQI